MSLTARAVLGAVEGEGGNCGKERQNNGHGSVIHPVIRFITPVRNVVPPCKAVRRSFRVEGCAELLETPYKLNGEFNKRRWEGGGPVGGDLWSEPNDRCGATRSAFPDSEAGYSGDSFRLLPDAVRLR